ncbi:phosphatidylglycerol lysyltransferase domain-containing protein [Coralliovum pocilloporae]|uniref:phosphatidylglycerol lysyltransferase domain-containing protein n=1 Tax=Coralliovum pocilloporae TaxID=3066369 RepID=UPI003306D1D4
MITQTRQQTIAQDTFERVTEEAQSSRFPSLRPLQDSDLGMLQRALLRTTRADAYSQSASYLAMTGRNGLWLYSTDDTFMVVASHPNKNDHLLLFPPMGREPAQLFSQALHDTRISSGQVQLARISEQDQLLLAWVQASGHMTVAPEGMLDWLFPVHTLSTKAVSEHKGRQFRNFRHGINLARDANLTASLIDLKCDKAAIQNLTNQWAAESIRRRYSLDDLVAPTNAILSLMENTELPLHGLMVQKNGVPVGFMTWEETDPVNRTATSQCGLAVEGKGVIEFIYLSMCEILNRRGFSHLCIGGSETAGLDQFKRKMNPVKSVPLQSAFTRQP